MIYEKLKQEFPNVKNGLVLGQALAIVGQFGYEIMVSTLDGVKYQTKYLEGDLIPIVRFTESGFFSSEGHPNFMWNYEKFKGLKFKKFTS